ncbi:hypothetical protein AB0I28_15700 [Phytomonospora sp. NPDC050363]|uniref:hypothetical protein n=1 Tax=Phytomonospora sp. NPDC050363 TaxID=3155642 RepID=UPI0033C01BAD
MTAYDEFQTLARLLVRGRFHEGRRLVADMELRGTGRGRGRYLAALFYLSVARRFPEGTEPHLVAGLVTEVRAHLDPAGEVFETRAAAVLVATALGRAEGFAEPVTAEAVSRLELLLVFHLLSVPPIGDGELDELLCAAARLAARG